MYEKGENMVFEDENMTLYVDVEETRKYYGNRLAHAGIKMENFTQQVEKHVPNLKSYLDRFGIDIAKPDELCWCWQDEKKRIHYNVAYTAVGNIEKTKKDEIVLADETDLHIVLEDKYIPSEQTMPCFGFTVYNIIMPWMMEMEYEQENNEEEKTILEELSKKVKKHWTKMKK